MLGVNPEVVAGVLAVIVAVYLTPVTKFETLVVVPDSDLLATAVPSAFVTNTRYVTFSRSGELAADHLNVALPLTGLLTKIGFGAPIGETGIAKSGALSFELTVVKVPVFSKATTVAE